MNSSEFFSIISPTINEADHIKSALLGIYARNYVPIEAVDSGWLPELFDIMVINHSMEPEQCGLQLVHNPTLQQPIAVKKSFRVEELVS